jgi:transcriptional regulator with XRE-family HTH domain
MARKSNHQQTPRAGFDETASLTATPKRAMKEEFARRLHHAMMAKGINQAQLSRATGIGKEGVHYYCAGKNLPGPVNAKKLADALDVPVEKLIPGVLLNATDHQAPDIEMRKAANGKTWISVNQVVEFSTAAKIIELIEMDTKSAKH